MPELDERIRAYIDAGARPVRIDEIVHAPGRRGSHRVTLRWGSRKLVIAAAIPVVLAALVLTVVLDGTPVDNSPHGRHVPMSATAVLARAAAVANAQTALVPGPGQYLYDQALEGTVNGETFVGGQLSSRFYIESIEQVWTSPSGPDARTIETIGQPIFVTPSDRANWQAAGSPAIGHGGDLASPPPYFDVANLPTTPSKMAAYFASQSYLPPPPAQASDSPWAFYVTCEFLQAGASSAQREALLKYMATIPGVFDAGSATSLGTKQTGTLLELPTNHPGEASEAIIDATTSELIEFRTVITNAAVFDAYEPVPLATGQAIRFSDFLYAGIANSSDLPPTGAPALPSVWPYGTTRAPASGSLYP